MEQINPGDLPSQWRERAQALRNYGGDPPAAKVWEVAATELERALRSFHDEALNLTKAAKVSGYSADHLGELVRKGKIPNAGRRNAPLIRRADLPMKAKAKPAPRRTPQLDKQKIASFADKLR